MTMSDAATFLQNEIDIVIKAWHTTYAADDPNFPAHILDTVTDSEKLHALDAGLYWAAMNGEPRGLYTDTATGTEPKLYDVDSTNYVRRPTTPTSLTTGDLDIDEGLALAVIYSAVSRLCPDCDSYSTRADKLVKDYTSAYKAFDKATAG